MNSSVQLKVSFMNAQHVWYQHCQTKLCACEHLHTFFSLVVYGSWLCLTEDALCFNVQLHKEIKYLDAHPNWYVVRAHLNAKTSKYQIPRRKPGWVLVLFS